MLVPNMENEIRKITNGYIINNTYVLQAIPNAFNNKTSYWISKEGMTVALYCFSTNNAFTVEEQLQNIDSYIKYFEEKVDDKKSNNSKDETSTNYSYIPDKKTDNYKFSLVEPITFYKGKEGIAKVCYNDRVIQVNFNADHLDHAFYYDKHQFVGESKNIHKAFKEWVSNELSKKCSE